MKPYYSDDAVILHWADSLKLLPELDIKADVLLTDPPYFKVKDDEWDNQWDKAHEFLSWLGDFLDLAKPVLAPNASVWVFASPAMTSSVERLVGERFRVLNSIRWVKEQGWHQKADLSSLRSYLTPWEGIVFAEQFDDVYGDTAKALHKQVFAPLGRYIQTERERAGLSQSDLAKHFPSATGGTTGCVSNWECGTNLPTERDYQTMQAVLNPFLRREYEDLRREYEDLRREYEDLRREYEDLRRPFSVKEKRRSTDVWDWPTVAPYPGKHPCEKPAAMLRHMIETTSRPGQLILDPFAGSSSTLEAAKATGRRAIGIEKNVAYCRAASYRLAQDAFDFGESA